MTGGWLGLLLVVAVAALMIVGMVLARPRGRSTDDPIEILRRRFARGEISADELEQATRALAC